MRSISIWVSLGVLLFTLCGCKPFNREIHHSDYKNDEGGTQATAMGMFFGISVDDRVNTDLGDDVDWRYILVTEPGELTVRLHVDNPYMMGIWYLRDGMGRPLHVERFDTREGFYEATKVPVEPGRYHFHLEAIRGSSIYTVESEFNKRSRSIIDVPATTGKPQQLAQRIPPKTEVIIVDDRVYPKKKRGRRKKKADVKKTEPEDKPLDPVISTFTGTLVLATPVKKNIVTARFKMDREVSELQEAIEGEKVLTIFTKTTPQLQQSEARVILSSCAGKLCFGQIKGKFNSVIKADQLTGKGIAIRSEIR